MYVNHKDYTIRPAKYAKNQFVISPTSAGNGWKTRAARLTEALGGRWVHRSDGYHVSRTKADRFVKLYDEGWDGLLFSRRLYHPVHAPV